MSPEKKLITQVMLQALEDLYRPPFTLKKRDIWTNKKICLKMNTRRSNFDFSDAKRWIFSDSEEIFSFLYICCVLDLNVDAVRERARYIIENNIKLQSIVGKSTLTNLTGEDEDE
jgi:hypothetical protein